MVPPGRLIPTKQLWGGNPVRFVKDLDVGEVWANYTKSYVNASMGTSHRQEFTTWNSAYMSRQSTQSDVEPSPQDLSNSYVDQDYYGGIVKHYI